MGKHQRAREFLEQALRISRETSDIQAESNWLGQLGNVQRLTGDLEKAIESHEQALAVSLKIGNTLGQMTQLVSLGIDYRLLGEYLKARDKYLEASEIAKMIGNVDVHRIALTDLGILYADYLKDHEKAYVSLAQAIQLLEEMRSSLVSEEFKITFVGERVNAYSEMVLLCLAMGREEEAFEYAERGKSRALIDLIGNRRIDPKKIEEKGLVVEAERLRCLINRLRKELEQIPAEVENRRNPRFEEHVNKIRETERKEIEIWNEIKRRNPEYNSLRQVDPITLEETQKMLDEEFALIEYYVTIDKAIAFVVTEKNMHCETLHLSQKNLSEMLIDPTTNQLIEPSRENGALISDLLKDLHKVLFAPLKETLEKNGIKGIYFSPHGLLHLLPLHALYEDTPDGRHFVIQDYAVAYVPSASVLRYCIRKGNKKANLFAVKNPDGSLKYADSEVEEVSKLFESRIILDRANGTCENVLSQAAGHGLVHFACHGLFRGDIPQQSGLKLADGWLTMIDIMNNLTLDANLVTLSACQTGRAKLTGGDEVVGLTRAFLNAGAPSVIASLWSVDDESTSMLFQRFYAYLKKGEDKAKALQKAQIDIMNFRRTGTFGRPFSHPYFWAPFFLIGDWRSSATTHVPETGE
jgi:CHAT domain-containing protein